MLWYSFSRLTFHFIVQFLDLWDFHFPEPCVLFVVSEIFVSVAQMLTCRCIMQTMDKPWQWFYWNYFFFFVIFFSLLNTIKKLIGNWWQKSLWKILASKLDWNILGVEVIYDISSEKENNFQRYCLCIPLHQIPSLSASPCFISFIIMCFEQLLNICTTSWRSSIREHCSLWGLFF